MVIVTYIDGWILSCHDTCLFSLVYYGMYIIVMTVVVVFVYKSLLDFDLGILSLFLFDLID